MGATHSYEKTIKQILQIYHLSLLWISSYKNYETCLTISIWGNLLFCTVQNTVNNFLWHHTSYSKGN